MGFGKLPLALFHWLDSWLYFYFIFLKICSFKLTVKTKYLCILIEQSFHCLLLFQVLWYTETIVLFIAHSTLYRVRKNIILNLFNKFILFNNLFSFLYVFWIQIKDRNQILSKVILGSFLL